MIPARGKKVVLGTIQIQHKEFETARLGFKEYLEVQKARSVRVLSLRFTVVTHILRSIAVVFQKLYRVLSIHGDENDYFL
jgi:hypothetical protein